MIRTNFKIGFRNIIKNKGFFALNTGGLVIGLTAVLLISLWINSELNYNKSFSNYDDIVGVMQKVTRKDGINTYRGQPWQLAPVLRREYGNHFKHVVTSSQSSDFNVSFEGNKLMAVGRFAEPGFPEMLDLKMIKGDRKALKDISSVLISESTAKNIFGALNPIGKTFKISNALDVKVAGVYQDISSNSSFKDVEFIAAWDLLKKRANYEKRLGWGNYWFRVYAQLNEGSKVDEVANLIKDVTNKNYKDRTRDYQLFLFPMAKWRLYSEFKNGVNVGGRIEYVKIFGIIGIFILLLACINFMNLSTAYALRRGKEVGVRKTFGSSRIQLVFQFFTESFIIIFFSFVVSMLLAYLLLPQFNTITLKEITFPFFELSFWGISISLLILTAVVSSFYPSMYLSRFRPVKVLKGITTSNKGEVAVRKGLIVVQFAISSILIIGTITVISQINHAKNRPIGFNKDLLVSIPINNSKVRNSIDVIKRELESSEDIAAVSASDVKITAAYTDNGGSWDWKNKDPELHAVFRTIRSTHGFGKMIEWEVIKGRDFSPKFPSDSLSILINETSVKYMGLENPVGEWVSWGDNGTFKIIGVVKNMVTRSPFDPSMPELYLLHKGDFLSYVNVKIANTSQNSIQQGLSKMKEVFLKHDPQSIFTYSFMDEEHERKFNSERQVAKLVGWFSLVAIFISCLGVLGLSTYMAIQRKKEIGVRKVLGASVQVIWKLLSKQFIVLVTISLIIATPLGYYFSTQWLMEYSYRIQLDFWVFLMAAVLVLGITLITVSYQAIKSAKSNPADSLRTE